ncbi:MAG: prepilin-type N-terminal cleavage/methylation domain-containing protein, partial [Thermodesulfovibrionia bacterium]|nr:prepilin-type N-terminal cleavage/methylation domain-containing protein [Thermodesulfovibrionia bacterium]
KNYKFQISNLQFQIYNSPSPTPLPQGEGARGRGGFTLIELMIAITITVLAMAAVYTSFIVQQRSFTTQDQVAETELSSKIGFDMLINDIRDAGFGYPDDDNAVNGFTGAITAIDSGINNGPDTLTLVGGFRQIATLQSDTSIGANQIQICYCTAPPCSSAQFNIANRSNLSVEGLTFATITAIIVTNPCTAVNPIILTLDRDMTNSIPAGRPVYLVEDVTYQINGTDLQKVVAGGGAGNVDTIANNIDDLQFSEIDQDGDGDTDRLRISLLARTAGQDQTLDPNTKPYFATGITLENNTTADTDLFRRRIWSMEVALRN